jgi:sn-glycerol 3-phosphate transport system ATP-binding protein
MNLLRLAPRDDGAVVDGTDGPVVLPAACAGGMLGVRPEHVALAERGVRASVQSIEYLGGDSLVMCRVGDGRLAVRAPGRVPVRAGDTVDLDWPPGAVHYFEASGRSVGVPSRRGAAALA